MKIKMLFDRVLAKELESKTTTKSGITLDYEGLNNIKRAKVISVGTGNLSNGGKIPMQVKVDDIIMYEDFASVKFKDGMEEYVILKQDDIIGIEEE